MDYVDTVFGPAGLLSAKFPGYAPRAGQVALARAVGAAIASGAQSVRGAHLLAEAPTGTGKSLAYLVPAIYAVMEGRAARAVVVTANIALQEQLVKKDLPLLREILPRPFSYALLKGRNNFLCLDRLRRGATGRLDDADREMNRQILGWAEITVDGDVSELPFEPPHRLWSRFSVSSDECTGKECEFFDECHAERAKKRAAESSIVVTNYHLFFADMQVRRASGGFASALPPYHVAILDEGHKAVDIARDFFGFRVTEGAVTWAGSMLSNEQKIGLETAQRAFFSRLLAYRRSSAYNSRLRAIDAVPSGDLVAALGEAARTYHALLDDLGPIESAASSEERQRIKKVASKCNRAGELREQVLAAMRIYALPKSPWQLHPDVDPAAAPESRWYWSDPAQGGDNTVRSQAQLATIEDVFFIEEDRGSAALCSRPISVAARIEEDLFNRAKSVSVTSATLAVRSSFEFVATELGAKEPQTLLAESPFTWGEQALLVLPQDVPEPNHPSFSALAAERCAQTIELARGRTLGLFTSYKNLNAAHERALKTKYRILRQGDMPRTKLIDEFRRDVNSVLLGTESFWAGVDVPGESLSCVFIDRLPFATPDDPVMGALAERDPQGWFKKYSVPKAIIAFKQGFGRLIRTTTDRGAVVVLDKRVTTKFYGKFFLESLPPTKRSFHLDDVRRFLDGEALRTDVPATQWSAPPSRPSGGSLFDKIAT